MRWTPCSDDANVATMAAEKAIICVLFESFSEADEIFINMCLILQKTLDVTVTALAVQNKTEHPSQVKGFVETVLPNYCDPTFASHFRMKIHFIWRIIHVLPPRLCYDLYDLIFIVSTRLIIISDHCFCVMIFKYLPLYNQRGIETFMKVSLHNTIAKYINM